MADDTQPLSLRDRIRQLEQAARSPLTSSASASASTFPPAAAAAATAGSHRGPTSAAAQSLAVEPVAQADDPLQSRQESKPYVSARSQTADQAAHGPRPTPPRPPPPPKPLAARPVWNSTKPRTDSVATDAPGVAPKLVPVERRSAAAVTTSGVIGRNSASAAGPTTVKVSTTAAPIHSRTDDATVTVDKPRSGYGAATPSPPAKPAVPARPAVATTSVARSPVSDPLRAGTLSRTALTSDSGRADSPRTSSNSVPTLPPRPTWAQKPPPTAARDPALEAPTSRGPGPVVLSTEYRNPLHWGTATPTASTKDIQVAPRSDGKPDSPALPPRPRWTPSPAMPDRAVSASEPAPPAAGDSRTAGANARRRYDRLFSQCLEASPSHSTVGTGGASRGGPSSERLDAALVGEVWRRSRLDDAVLRKIWCVLRRGPLFPRSRHLPDRTPWLR